MKHVLINIDCGETELFPDNLMELCGCMNIGAGAHAGSWELSVETIEQAKRLCKIFCAHPGYPDPEEFGRLSFFERGDEAWLAAIKNQVDLLVEQGATHLKPHGALYHDTLISGPPADTLRESLDKHKLTLIGQPSSFHEEIARETGSPFLSEGFADRRYKSDGSLVPRTQPDALISEPTLVAVQAVQIALDFDTLCLHSDREGFDQRLMAVHQALIEAHFTC